jgi:hypothetical protein
MSTVKISQLAPIPSIRANTSNTLLMGVDIPTGITGKFTARTLARDLYANEVLNVGNRELTLPNTAAQFAASGNSYIQTNLVNTNDGGTADIVVTANTGSDTTYFLDTGYANKDFVPGSEYNSLGTAIYPLDGYIYVQGSEGHLGGNLTIGTTVSNTEIKFIAGGGASENVIAKIKHGGFYLVNDHGITFSDGTVQVTSPAAAGLSANSAFIKANASYSSQNTTGTYANSAYASSNSASLYANGAFIQANAAFLQANTPNHVANSAALYANGSFVQSNAAFIHANSAFEKANLAYSSSADAAFLQSNAAFLKANSAYGSQNTTGTYANSAYEQANTATNNAAGASQYANTGFNYANSAYVKANSAYTVATSANGQLAIITPIAQQAYTWGEGALQNTTGTFAGTLAITENLNVNGTIKFANATFTSTQGLVTISASNTGATQPTGGDGYVLHMTGKHNVPVRVVSDSFGANGQLVFPLFGGRAARGNVTNPSAVQTGDVLTRIGASGFGATSYQSGGTARIDFIATENHTDTARGTAIKFYNVQEGSNTLTQIASFNANTVTITGTVNPQKGFSYTPRILSGDQTAITIDFATDSMIRATFGATVTNTLSNYVAGKIVEMWLTNTAGNGQTVVHGCLANNSTIGATSLSIASGRSVYLKYFSIDGDQANTFVAVTYA